jgi:hypothetical protein
MGRVTLPGPKDHWVTTWVICGIILIVGVLGVTTFVLYRKGLIKGPIVESMINHLSKDKEPTGSGLEAEKPPEKIEMQVIASQSGVMPGASHQASVMKLAPQ